MFHRVRKQMIEEKLPEMHLTLDYEIIRPEYWTAYFPPGDFPTRGQTQVPHCGQIPSPTELSGKLQILKK